MIEFAFGNSGEYVKQVANVFLFIKPNKTLNGKSDASESVIAARDDWPNFYMRNRTIPAIYLKMIFIILAFSMILIFTTLPMKISKTNGEFFLAQNSYYWR